LGEGGYANEVEMNHSIPRVSYVFERESELGGREHEAAYIEAFIQVMASIRAHLGHSLTAEYKGIFLSSEEGSRQMTEFSRIVYWDEDDGVRLPLVGEDLELLCNADPIAFALLARGQQFP
jgi:hypothetical protein